MMKRTITLLAVVLMCVLASANGAAHQGVDSVRTKHEVVGRKRVGVVLSGGGAKGMVHIGVLKVLEKAGIPIDVVTGTSMGSIIGGLYSIGYNAYALDSMVRVQDWGYLISDRENMHAQSLSDRKKQNTYFINLNLSRKKDKNVGGFIKGKNLAELFQRVCVGYTDSLDFSKDLPIPFACVATNLIDNTEVVLSKGYLPQAMRASMAIPAVFTPVRMGDMVLIDGGLRNNYPADIARQMGADIIIGVTMEEPPKTADDLKSTMSILTQLIEINCSNKLDENLAITDLHLNVDTKGYGPASFSEAAVDTLIRRGEEEGMRHWDEIIALKKRIGIDSTFQPVIHQPLRPKVLTEKQHITGFTFENMTPQAEKFIRQKHHLNKTDSIDAKLEQQLTTTMRMDLFYNTAECRLVPDGDGVRVVLSAGNRKTARFHAGIRFDTEEYAAVQLGVSIPLKTAVPVNTELTARLGKRMMARAEITAHPRNFTRPSFSYTFYHNDIDVYTKGERDYNILYNQSQAELVPINVDLRHFNLKLGLRWDYLHYRNGLGTETTSKVPLKNEHFISYRALLTYNSEDDWNFPSRGVRFNAQYAYITNNFGRMFIRDAEGNKVGKTAGLSDVSAHWRVSFPLSRRFSLQPMVYGRLLFGSVTPAIFGNTIGGDWFGRYIEQQMPFAGLGCMEYVDNHFVAAQLQAQEHIGKSHYILLRIAAAQHSDKLREIFQYRTLFGVQGAYFYNTMFGPIGAALGYSNYAKSMYFYINLGYEF